MTTQLFRNAIIYSPLDRETPAAGPRQGDLVRFHPGAMLVKDGIIVGIGDEKSILTVMSDVSLDGETDCRGQCMIPGFVDPHTHICFAERREAEFAQRIAGTPYLEILRKGGGILSSVRAMARTDEDRLLEVTLNNALSALELGTTTIVITHNAPISKMANRMVQMQDGLIVTDEHNPTPVAAKELTW